MHDHKTRKVDGRGSDASLGGPSRGHTPGHEIRDPGPEDNLDWTLNLVESFFASRRPQS